MFFLVIFEAETRPLSHTNVKKREDRGESRKCEPLVGGLELRPQVEGLGSQKKPWRALRGRRNVHTTNDRGMSHRKEGNESVQELQACEGPDTLL